MALPEPPPRDLITPAAAKPKRPLVPRLFTWGTWGGFALLFAVSVWQTGFNLEQIGEGFGLFFRFFSNFWPPAWEAWREIWRPLLQTVQMAYLGTLFGVILGAPWVFWASRNTTLSGPFLWFARGLMTVLRSIPDLLYAGILVGILSFGPLPGVVALTIFTMSILAKLGSEYVEAIDPGPLEALKAAGASGTHVIIYAVIPQVAANMLSFILYIFEVNVRASTVLGFVGAGGVGQLLNTYLANFDYRGIMTLLIIVFVVVAIIDSVSAWARARLT